MRLVEAVAVYAAGVDALLSADVDADTPAEIAAALVDIETASRRVPMVGYTILARLQREAVPTDHGVTSWWKLLTLNCRISKARPTNALPAPSIWPRTQRCRARCCRRNGSPPPPPTATV